MAGRHASSRSRLGLLLPAALAAAVVVGALWGMALLRQEREPSEARTAEPNPEGSRSPGTEDPPPRTPQEDPPPSSPPTPRERSQEPPPKLGYAPTGHLATVPGSSPAEGRGTPHRYSVQVERGLPIAPEEFAVEVESVLGDPRGWNGAFKRVDDGAMDFRVVLASATLTDELCAPLQTNGIYSCFQAGRAVLNWMRWRRGADAYGSELDRYRVYMINHEVGHALGYGHVECPGAGRPAPIMMQQTKGVYPCRANPWPKVDG